ncbi:centromere protein X isoform X1 [Wolffia australiana]
MDELSLDPELILSIFKLVWSKKSAGSTETVVINNDELVAGTSKKIRQLTGSPASTLIWSTFISMYSTEEDVLVTEAIQRAAVIAEAEGSARIEPTHFERVLPQLLLDF